MTSVLAPAQSAPPESSAYRATATTSAAASFVLIDATPHSSVIDAASHGGARTAEREQVPASSARASAVDDGNPAILHRGTPGSQSEDVMPHAKKSFNE